MVKDFKRWTTQLAATVYLSAFLSFFLSVGSFLQPV